MFAGAKREGSSSAGRQALPNPINVSCPTSSPKSASESHSEFESFSEETEGDGEQSFDGVHADDLDEIIKDEGKRAHVTYRPPENEGSSWADIDLSIAVAIISPLGNWLTGGDHIKDFLVGALLIFYLHQLIQVPWELYRTARPRRPHPNIAADKSSPQNARLVTLARTELRLHELMYLVLSVASPFLGVSFLRYILSTLSGSDPLSWFSTTLFVLATGVRPWGHLISRLRQRANALHDTVHYPRAGDEATQALLARVEALEHEMRKVKGQAAGVEGVEDACDELTGAMEEMEKNMRRSYRKAEAARVAQENRLAVVEKGLSVVLEEHMSRQRGLRRVRHQPSLTSSLSEAMFYVPRKALELVSPDAAPQPERKTKNEKLRLPGAHHSPTSSVLLTPTRLETIMEDSDSSGSDDAAHAHANANVTHVELPGKKTRGPSVVIAAPPKAQSSILIESIAYLFTWPYRLSVKFLSFFTLPLRQIASA